MQPVLITRLGRVYHADCVEVLRTIPSGTVDLIFADPPFNLGKDYGSQVSDARPEVEYLAWCRAWIDECVRVLTPGGAFYLFHLPRWNIELGHHLTSAGMMFRHWIAVYLTLGFPIRHRLYPAHYSLLYYTKGRPARFEPPRVPVPVCRHCGGDVKDYGGHRNKLHPDGLSLSDVWTDIPPVRHRSTKTRRANELSEKLLERVLTISTRPGDLVLDPFGGSGTTYAVAERMDRAWIGAEIGDIDPIRHRLAALQSYRDADMLGL